MKIVVLVFVATLALGLTAAFASPQDDIAAVRQQAHDQLKSPYKAQVQQQLVNASAALDNSDSATACADLSAAEGIITTAGNASGSGINPATAAVWNGEIEAIRAEVPCS